MSLFRSKLYPNMTSPLHHQLTVQWRHRASIDPFAHVIITESLAYTVLNTQESNESVVWYPTYLSRKDPKFPSKTMVRARILTLQNEEC